MIDRFAGTPTTSAPGAPIPITFTNPNEAGHTVEIEVDDDAGNVTKLKVQLDSTGKGTATFTPDPGYVGSLGLNGPDSDEHQIMVTAPVARARRKATRRRSR